MLPKLQNSQKLNLELKKYSKEISKIENLEVKRKAENLISMIRSQVALIDEGHNIVTNTNIDPRNLRSNIARLSELRYQLKKIVNDIK